eukprot:m.29611 g.29611  ORF g.29611 m.29611 type:complete len:68 (-) comp11957_c0_seq1:67-270(-)
MVVPGRSVGVGSSLRLVRYDQVPFKTQQTRGDYACGLHGMTGMRLQRCTAGRAVSDTDDLLFCSAMV